MRQRIYIEAQALSDFPDCQGVKKLVNHERSFKIPKYTCSSLFILHNINAIPFLGAILQELLTTR